MLSALRIQGLKPSQIARQLGRAPSTITREIKRNTCNDGGYRPFKADSRTRGRRSRSRRNERLPPSDFRLVEQYIKKDWSPEQISNCLQNENILSISHESIYLHIWLDKQNGGTLYTHLRGARKQRRKRYQAYDSRGKLAGKRHISERPIEAEERTEIGHWEIDTVHGKGSKDCILTLVERVTGFTLIGKLKSCTKNEVIHRATKLIKQHAARFKTITSDNGTEFHGYKSIERKTGVRFYFATPHHSWERGTNENTNGLIRQYLPKGTSMASLSQQLCNSIAKKLNTRPRKRLGFKTPEVCYAT